MIEQNADNQPFLLNKTDANAYDTILKHGSSFNKRGLFYEDDCGVLVDKKMRCHVLRPDRSELFMSFFALIVISVFYFWLFHVHLGFNQLMCLIQIGSLAVLALLIAFFRWRRCKTTRIDFYMIAGGMLVGLLLTVLDKMDLGKNFERGTRLFTIRGVEASAEDSGSVPAPTEGEPTTP